MFTRHLNQLKNSTLTELIDSGPAFDDLPGFVYDLQAAIEDSCRAGRFIDFCRSLGLATDDLERALGERALSLAEADGPDGN